MGILSGLFQGKTITQVSTSVSRVVEDKLIPNSVKTGAIRDLIGGDDMLVEHVMDAVLNGPAVTTEQMYRWAKDKYIYGLPDASYLTNNAGNNLVKAVIQDIEGKPVNIVYSQYGALNSLHYGWEYLFNSHQYDFESNEIKSLSQEKVFQVYLVKMVAVIPEGLLGQLELGALDQWGPSSSNGYTPSRPTSGLNIPALAQNARMDFVVDSSAPEEAIEYTYCWLDNSPQQVGNSFVPRREYKEETVRTTIPFSQEQQNAGRFQVMYTVDIPHSTTTVNPDTLLTETNTTYSKQYKCFTYLNGSGTYPELDELFEPKYSDLGEFFPFTYFRYDFKNMADDRNSDHYKSSKKLCKKLGFDYETVADAVNENPDIGGVRQAIMAFAVPANTKDPFEQKYLFDFFYRSYVKTGAVSSSIFTEVDPNDPLGLYRVYVPQPALTSIVIKDTKFQMSVNFRAIRSRFKTGTVASIGQFKSGTGVDAKITPIRVFDSEGQSMPFDHQENVVYHYYQKQVAPGLYQEIKVYGLSTSFRIDGTYSTNASGDEANLLIPLDYSITDEYGIREREVLFTRSLHFIFNAQQSSKIKWYQKSWFRAVMIIVAIIWTVFTWGSDGGTALGAAIAAGEYAIAAMIVLEIILVNVAIGVAISAAMKFVARMIGGQAAMILAAVLTVVSLYYGTLGTATESQWAGTLLTAANGLVKAGMNELNLDLKKEYEAFNSEKFLKVKELEDMKKLLDQQTVLHPFTVFGESPRDYYNRVAHSGNVGVQSFELTHSYVDVALRLPTFNQSISLGGLA